MTSRWALTRVRGHGISGSKIRRGIQWRMCFDLTNTNHFQGANLWFESLAKRISWGWVHLKLSAIYLLSCISELTHCWIVSGAWELEYTNVNNMTVMKTLAIIKGSQVNASGLPKGSSYGTTKFNKCNAKLDRFLGISIKTGIQNFHSSKPKQRQELPWQSACMIAIERKPRGHKPDPQSAAADV